MKNLIYFFYAILLVALSSLYFSINAVNISDNTNKKPKAKITGNSQEKSYSFSKATILYAAQLPQLEFTRNSFKKLPANLKNPFTALLINNSAVKEHWLQNGSNYFLYSKNIIVRYRKSDLIFPFHYFW
ncbi:hypothetical protein DVK85_07585 [Flavobacterium arcticum]|uniref:Uncharacterized protein n=1 Tax=Flavobacterium arcticum TaxID=1784713 RepID=A0A345HBZ9_9FLAO|nr:hypothetical protein [Flavobacterium arcticum]AXG74109.1 hypothetical protein DVK85_07585 [Flavobacterium arcticum]KAF2507331.1 hypothetical protein E0W72_12310 [Flavobacterium arcticum]